MTRTPRLRDDLGHLLNLSLRATEGTELCGVSSAWKERSGACGRGRGGRLWRAVVVVGKTYPLLRETTSTLVLGVAEEFDDALLVGSETVASLAQAL